MSLPIHMADWLPSLLELAGIPNPEMQRLDGESIWKYLQNPEASPQPTRSFYWKIKGASAVREGDWKLLVRQDGSKELYDLKADFRETRDFSHQHPEKVKRLMRLLESYRNDDRD